jgi:hypothetical protein
MDTCTAKDCVGVICPAGQVCSLGACVCGPGETKCGDQCVNAQLDSVNCGGCGRGCDGGTSCAAATCIADDCAQQNCDPLSVCFNGACTERACVGVICSAGNTCHDGTCGCLSGVQCGSVCADTQLDSSNCGGCGSACDAGTKCAVGQCLPQSCGSVTCDPLSVCFGGTCVEAACVGVVCNGGAVCSKGACVCPLNKTACGETCADLTASAQNCGACGHPCDATESCINGQCVVDMCTGGKTNCAGTCTATSTDPANCGACGDACGGGRNCVNGGCQCPQSLTLCGSACVNLVTDSSNCGACGHSCGGGGCLSDGGCSCTGGLTSCGTGACVDLMSDNNNCLTCGHACAAGQMCTGGVCGCPTGQKLCGAACMDIESDNTNCGNCGVMCGPLQQCTNGACVDPVTCQTAYNDAGTCRFFPVDNTHCGAATVVETIPISGMLATTGNELPFAFDAGPGDRLDVTASYSTTAGGGANVNRRWRNSIQQQFGPSPTNTVGMPPAVLQDSITSSVYACAVPVDFVVRSTFSGPVTFSGNLVHSVLDRYNTGAPTAQLASSINLGDGGVCTQVCGDVKRTCGDTMELYRVTIPPRRAALFEWQAISVAGGGTNFDFTLWNPTGAVICQLAGNQLVGNTTPLQKRNRVVNNTDSPQDVVFGMNAWGTNGMSWNIAVTLE